MAKLPDTKIIKESSLYESEPLGDSKEWYVNGVIEIETELKPDALLSKFKNIERAMGRKKVRKRWGARIIDIDILLYDSMIEIAPQVIHPDLGMTISELLISVKDNKKVSLLRS